MDIEDVKIALVIIGTTIVALYASKFTPRNTDEDADEDEKD